MLRYKPFPQVFAVSLGTYSAESTSCSHPSTLSKFLCIIRNDSNTMFILNVSCIGYFRNPV